MTSVTKWLPHVGRVLLGLPFVVFGLAFFIPFIPMPPPEGGAGVFLGALVATRIMQAAKVVEIVAGLMLLSNRFVPLALTLLAPILIAILLFNVTYSRPQDLGLPIVLLALELALAWHHRHAFAGLLRARSTPPAPSSEPARVPAASAAT
jgi:putative oxidoreductase